jgi:hypothetical protein
MAENAEKGGKPGDKENFGERASRKLRNFGLIGAVALGGAALLAPGLAVASGVFFAGAAGAELARDRFAARRKTKKENPDSK